VIQPDGTLLFTPEPNQVGIVRLVYRVCSPTAPTVCDTATVTIYISPLAVPSSAVTYANRPVLIDAGANDLGDANLILVSAPPQHGTVVNEGGGLFTFTPANGFTGIDVFKYDRCDAFSRLCTSAPVTVTVLPSVFDDTATTFMDQPVVILVLANDVGAFANPNITDTPGNGSALVVGDHVVYSPNPGFVGEDVFTYSSCSPLRITFCSSAFVRVTVLAVDPPPTTTTTTTTTTPPPPTPPTTIGPDVLPPFPPSSSIPGQLVVTGADTDAPVGLAAVACVLGLGLLVVSRRPRRG
jgi:hypothetical protein